MLSKYDRYNTSFNNKYPYDWKPVTIKRIISNYEYYSHMVSNKNYKQSYKSKVLLKNDESKYIIVKNVTVFDISSALKNLILLTFFCQSKN